MMMGRRTQLGEEGEQALQGQAHWNVAAIETITQNNKNQIKMLKCVCYLLVWNYLLNDVRLKMSKVNNYSIYTQPAYFTDPLYQ